MENSPLLTNLTHVLILSLEFRPSPNTDVAQIPLIATHLSFNTLPKSVQSLESGAKMIYLCREPKDTFISLWYFMQRFTWLEHGEDQSSDIGITSTEFSISFEKEFDRPVL